MERKKGKEGVKGESQAAR